MPKSKFVDFKAVKAAVIAGMLLQWFVIPHAGRYSDSTQGSPDQPILIRIDTARAKHGDFKVAGLR